MSDLIVSIAAAVLFAVAAVRFGLTAFKSYKGTLPFGSSLGLRAAEVRTSEESWVKAHRAAAVLYAMGAAVSAFHSLALAFAPLTGNEGLRSFNAVLIVAGGAVVFAVTRLAEKAGVAVLRE